MERTVNIVWSCRVIFETVYFIIYVLVSTSQLFFARSLQCDVILNGLCMTISWSHYLHSSEWTQSAPSWDTYVKV